MDRILLVFVTLLTGAQSLTAHPIASTISQKTITRFFSAINNNDIKEIKLLLGRNKELVNATGSFGYPPLLAATKTGNTTTVHLLLNAGAHPDAQDIHGNTPLIRAAVDNSYAIAHLLITHGATINKHNSAGHSALAIARLKNHNSIVNLLIQHGRLA